MGMLGCRGRAASAVEDKRCAVVVEWVEGEEAGRGRVEGVSVGEGCEAGGGPASVWSASCLWMAFSGRGAVSSKRPLFFGERGEKGRGAGFCHV